MKKTFKALAAALACFLLLCGATVTAFAAEAPKDNAAFATAGIEYNDSQGDSGASVAIEVRGYFISKASLALPDKPGMQERGNTGERADSVSTPTTGDPSLTYEYAIIALISLLMLLVLALWLDRKREDDQILLRCNPQ
ncbi:MAG: hypothetical protein LBL36_02735 [Clostridiales Family XIII bacterium]|jgi:hypothetical protein|nr:hypothetical protein [Clostridiales Family XIII bacterium]